jgi:hypothetical protein
MIPERNAGEPVERAVHVQTASHQFVAAVTVEVRNAYGDEMRW